MTNILLAMIRGIALCVLGLLMGVVLAAALFGPTLL